MIADSWRRLYMTVVIRINKTIFFLYERKEVPDLEIGIETSTLHGVDNFTSEGYVV